MPGNKTRHFEQIFESVNQPFPIKGKRMVVIRPVRAGDQDDAYRIWVNGICGTDAVRLLGSEKTRVFLCDH